MSIATASTPITAKAPAWAAAMRRVTNYLVYDFGGGPRPWKFAGVIIFQKTGTFPLFGLLIAWYDNTSPRRNALTKGWYAMTRMLACSLPIVGLVSRTLIAPADEPKLPGAKPVPESDHRCCSHVTMEGEVMMRAILMRVAFTLSNATQRCSQGLAQRAFISQAA